MYVTAIQCTKCVLEVWPEFGIITDLGGYWIIHCWQLNICGVKEMGAEDIKYMSEIA